MTIWPLEFRAGRKGAILANEQCCAGAPDIVIPVYNEGANIVPTLRAIARREDARPGIDLLRS